MTAPTPVPTALASWPAGRAYRKLFKLASGGMGTVHVGVLEGALGFRQVVALKEAHAHLLEDPHIRRTLVEEAQLAARIHHANVVEVRDVEVTDQGITLVMPYIDGASLADLWLACTKAEIKIPPAVALRIALDSCAGLAAAHALTDEDGAPLGIVHRDVSPHNLLIGADGVTRVSDFGVAKHRRADGYSTTHGTFKGKLAYSSPEVLRGQGVDARLDVFSMAVVLWELLTMERLFLGEGDLETLERVQRLRAKKVSTYDPSLAALDPILEKALEKSKTARTASIADLAASLEEAARGNIASHRDVAALLTRVLGSTLEERRALIRDRLRAEGTSVPLPPPAPSLGPAFSPNTSTQPALASGLEVFAERTRRRSLWAAVLGVVVALGLAAAVFAREGAPPIAPASNAAPTIASAAARPSSPSPPPPPSTATNAELTVAAPTTTAPSHEPAKPNAVIPVGKAPASRSLTPRGKRGTSASPAAPSSTAPAPPPNPY